MKRGIIYTAILLTIALFPLISADIYVDQLRSLYNVGDVINANITLSSRLDTSGFFSAFLVCGTREIETYKSMEFISANQEKHISIIAILDNGLLSSSENTCFIRALYGAGEARSQPFMISRKINVEVRVEPPIVFPGEDVSVSGMAVKDNRAPLNGFVEIKVEGIQAAFSDFETVQESLQETNASENETSQTPEEEQSEEITAQGANVSSGSFTGEVRGGNFTAKFTMPENTPPGTYKIIARAYDMDNHGVILNTGESSSDTIRVKQVIKDIDIAFNSNSVIPGNEFIYTAIIYDQAKNNGAGELAIEIHRPDKSLFFGKLVNAGETNTLPVDANFTPGYWEITAEIEDIKKSKLFYVEELQKISTSMLDGVLTITNIGNVPYKKQIEISIGGKSEVRKVNLEIGKSIQFKLGAPDGEYAVSINDGQTTQDLGSTFLTGRAIGIDEIGGVLFSNAGIYIWTLLIVILLVVVLILIRKIFKKKYIGKIPKSLAPVSKISPQITNMYQKKETFVSPPSISNIMERGEKQEASIIALKIKNLRAIQTARNYTNNPLEDIDKALLEAKTAGSKIYVDNDYRIIVFVPSITKTKENDMTAINIAKEIETILLNHNQTSPNKIDFGIGVHSGMMGVETREGRIKFVSLDNTITIVKRIAERSNCTVLMSDQIHKKTLGKVKVEKVEGTSFWVLGRIMDRAHYDEFIKRFLNRQNKK